MNTKTFRITSRSPKWLLCYRSRVGVWLTRRVLLTFFRRSADNETTLAVVPKYWPWWLHSWSFLRGWLMSLPILRYSFSQAFQCRPMNALFPYSWQSYIQNIDCISTHFSDFLFCAGYFRIKRYREPWNYCWRSLYRSPWYPIVRNTLGPVPTTLGDLPLGRNSHRFSMDSWRIWLWGD